MPPAILLHPRLVLLDKRSSRLLFSPGRLSHSRLKASGNGRSSIPTAIPQVILMWNRLLDGMVVVALVQAITRTAILMSSFASQKGSCPLARLVGRRSAPGSRPGLIQIIDLFAMLSPLRGNLNR